MKQWRSLGLVLALVSVAGTASAQSATAWDGFYLGARLGGETTHACNSSTLVGTNIDPASATFNRCSSGGLTGGVQLGEAFQIKKLVFGIGADLVTSEAKSADSTLQFSGAAPPAGTYSLSGKLSPKDFAIVSARIGYGGSLLFPYLRGGVVVSSSQSSTLAYIPAGTSTPSAAFSSGKNFNSTGWVAGAGAEIGLNGAWSLSAEYLHMSLGKGASASASASCAGAADGCSTFAGVSLENVHNGFTANLIQIGINYWFNYWDKP